MLDLPPPPADYRRLQVGGVRTERQGGRAVLVLSDGTLSALAREAFLDMAHLYRAQHLAALQAILADPLATPADRYVALEMLKNAVVASGRQLPGCQDTGTAQVFARKGEAVMVEGEGDAAALERGIAAAYRDGNLRYSHLAALSMYDEANTGTNLPAEIDIGAVAGGRYELLFVAKGGGSANRSLLFQAVETVLTPEKLLPFLAERVRAIGTTACPPYHLAVAIGGLSAEQTMRVAKLASCRYLDHLPETGDRLGRAFRDTALEASLLEESRGFGFGAQLGGRYFCHDVRVVRLPRHSGCLPIGIAVSCSADRQALARVDAEGVWLEELERDPARFLPDPAMATAELPPIDLDGPPGTAREALARLPVGTPVRLSGTMVSARDQAHARFRALLRAGRRLPDYLLRHPIYYAGPAKAPPGRAVGSFGPTTSARMDDYVPELQAAGASLVMLGKGNRSAAVVEACRSNGGFYLASIGGIAARLSHDFIESAEVVDHADLGMEAVWRLRVRDLPACIIVNDRGEDFYAAPGKAA